MLHRVALVRTDVSEELNASIIRVIIGELGTLAVTNPTHAAGGQYHRTGRYCFLPYLPDFSFMISYYLYIHVLLSC
jgi:hypothetical protein